MEEPELADPAVGRSLLVNRRGDGFSRPLEGGLRGPFLERTVVVTGRVAGAVVERAQLERTVVVLRGVAGAILERTQLERTVVERPQLER